MSSNPHPSQPMRSLLFDFRLCENYRHYPRVRLERRSSGRQILKFPVQTGDLAAPSLCYPFSNFRFGMPETGSICDGDRFAELISRLHRRQGGKMD